jgi:predicted methyltransferase
MIKRRTTLDEALVEIESGVLDGVKAIVVNAEWWESQSKHEQNGYRLRCDGHGIQLRADEALSRHFVELASDSPEPPLSTERRV